LGLARVRGGPVRVQHLSRDDLMSVPSPRPSRAVTSPKATNHRVLMIDPRNGRDLNLGDPDDAHVVESGRPSRAAHREPSARPLLLFARVRMAKQGSIELEHGSYHPLDRAAGSPAALSTAVPTGLRGCPMPMSRISTGSPSAPTDLGRSSFGTVRARPAGSASSAGPGGLEIRPGGPRPRRSSNSRPRTPMSRHE
jgi:hypothetical protein